MTRKDWVLAESAVPEESKSTVRALPFVEILSGSDMLFSMILYDLSQILCPDGEDRFLTGSVFGSLLEEPKPSELARNAFSSLTT